MDNKKLFYSAIALFASFTFFSCSNDSDEVGNIIENEKTITSINVGCPSIETEGSSATTRVTFEYDKGLKMEWEAGDVIVCNGWRTKDASFARGYTRDATADAAGATTTFTTSSAWTAYTTETPYTYTIIYHNGWDKDNPSKGAHTSNWKSATISNTQTQAGNDNTAHLKENYYAILQNINTISDITFSSEWANDHAAAIEINTGEGKGKFIQNGCIKLDLTLPANTKTTKIYGVRIRAFEGGTTTGRYIFYRKADKSDSPQNSLNLKMTGIPDDTNTAAYNLVGYIMLPPVDLTIPANTDLNIQIAYDGEVGAGGVHYYSRTVNVASETTIKAGKLTVIKLKGADKTDWNN